MTTIRLSLPDCEYNITVGRGILKNADKYLNLNKKVFIITDDGVPTEYSRTVATLAKEAKIFTVKQGESAKSIAVLEEVLSAMLDFNMTRGDTAIAVGGGVVGDLTGFAAACYMRGIDFYNIPTTLLSQVDSSIGGKTAVNLGKVKNIVGAFHQPKGVLIDTDVLSTLPKRQIAAGLAEAVKMSLTSDPELFSIFETEDISLDNIEKVITRSLMIKKNVVEADEKEAGLRKILNFGHTLGHAIEAQEELHGLYHGECVALGMLPVTSQEVRERLIKVLKKLDLPTEYNGNLDDALKFMAHDKKCSGKTLSAIFVDEVGKCRIEKLSMDEFSTHIKNNF